MLEFKETIKDGESASKRFGKEMVTKKLCVIFLFIKKDILTVAASLSHFCKYQIKFNCRDVLLKVIFIINLHQSQLG